MTDMQMEWFIGASVAILGKGGLWGKTGVDGRRMDARAFCRESAVGVGEGENIHG